MVCLSPYHFSRSFKQAGGVGPQHYVIQRRLERAKTLLRRTNHPLALIAGSRVRRSGPPDLDLKAAIRRARLRPPVTLSDMARCAESRSFQ